MRRPSLAEVHAEIERLIELAAATADPGTRAWYERQGSRWESNRPAPGATCMLCARPIETGDPDVKRLAPTNEPAHGEVPEFRSEAG